MQILLLYEICLSVLEIKFMVCTVKNCYEDIIFKKNIKYDTKNYSLHLVWEG